MNILKNAKSRKLREDAKQGIITCSDRCRVNKARHQANLDQKTAEKIFKGLEKASKKGKTTFVYRGTLNSNVKKYLKNEELKLEISIRKGKIFSIVSF